LNATLAEVLRELTIAWKNRVAYPEGHPARAAALARAHGALAGYLEIGPLLLGVAADGWVTEEGKLAAAALQPFAKALYSREVALVGFETGLAASELDAFLDLLGADPRGVAVPVLRERLIAAGVRHVYLEAMDFSQLGLEAETAGLDRRRQIWDLILDELVAGRQLSPDGRELDPESRRRLDELSALLAEALQGESDVLGRGGEGAALPGDGAGGGGSAEEGAGTSASGALAVTGKGGGAGGRFGTSGRRLAALMAAVFAPARGRSSISVARRLAAVVRALPESLRRALIDAILSQLASAEENGEALDEFAGDLPRMSVLASLHRLLEESVPLSARAVRLAKELMEAVPDALVVGPPSAQAERLFGELKDLYGSADIDRLNPPVIPPAGTPLALDMPRSRTFDTRLPEAGAVPGDLSDEALAEQLARALLELAQRQAPYHLPQGLMRQLRSQFRTVLGYGHLTVACEIAGTLRTLIEDPSVKNEERLQLRLTLDRMADRRAVAALLDGVSHADEADIARILRLMDLLGPRSRRHLLEALVAEPIRSRRHLLLRILTAFGEQIAGDVAPLLSDTQWYVVRNAIVLLRSVGARSALAEIARRAGHSDARVRLEAIKTVLALEGEVPPEALRSAILDSDLKLAEGVVSLIGAYRVVGARDALIDLLAFRDAFGRRRTLRLKAIKVLASLRDPSVLPRLRRFFRSRWFAAPREERLAAFAALAYYPAEARQALVKRGLRSRDAELRSICEGLRDGAVSEELEETHG
jgi:hypothetical protein